MLLSYETLLESIGTNIIIYPLNISNVKGSSIHVTYGKWAWSLTSQQSIYCERNGCGILTIQAHDRVIVISNEVIGIDNSLSCNIYTKTINAALGLTYINGLIDPGYTGRLIFQLENYSDNPIEFTCGKDEMAIVTFSKLDKPTENLYAQRSGHSAILHKLGIELPQEYLIEVEKTAFQNFDLLNKLLKNSMQYKEVAELVDKRKLEQKAVFEKRNTYKVKRFLKESWYLLALLILTIGIAFTPIQDTVKVFLSPSIALIGLIINKVKTTL